MEENRNIDFNSEVEVDSLKDAVWRLTTRVYLLEDFIAETFGQVIGPNGFTKASILAKNAAGPSVSQTSSTFSTTTSNRSQNVIAGSGSSSGRKRRKRHHAPNSRQVESPGSKMSKNEDNPNSMEYSNEASRSSIGINLIDSEQSETDLLLIPKDEILLREGEEYPNDDFLNEKSDEDDDHNDSVDRDPDFNPLNSTDGPSQIQEKRKILRPKETEVHFVKSQRGKDKLVNSGFVYCHIKDLKSGASNWVCEKRPRCRASISYSKVKGIEILKDHDHTPDPGRLEVLTLMEKIRYEAETSDTIPSSSSIYEKAIAEVSQEVAANINVESCKRLIRKRLNRKTDKSKGSNKELKGPL